MLRYLEEAGAEAWRLHKLGGAQPGELSAIEFAFNKTYDVTLAKIREESKGVLLGPVTVGGAGLNATYGALDEHR